MIDLGNLGVVNAVATPAQAIMHQALCGRDGREAILTPREVSVVRLLADGKSHQEIAAALGLSKGTIRTYVWGLYQRGWTTAGLWLAGTALNLTKAHDHVSVESAAARA